MDNQVPMELGHTPKIWKLFVDDAFFDRRKLRLAFVPRFPGLARSTWK
jgi:hypothetical protein